MKHVWPPLVILLFRIRLLCHERLCNRCGGICFVLRFFCTQGMNITLEFKIIMWRSKTLEIIPISISNQSCLAAESTVLVFGLERTSLVLARLVCRLSTTPAALLLLSSISWKGLFRLWVSSKFSKFNRLYRFTYSRFNVKISEKMCNLWISQESSCQD